MNLRLYVTASNQSTHFAISAVFSDLENVQLSSFQAISEGLDTVKLDKNPWDLQTKVTISTESPQCKIKKSVMPSHYPSINSEFLRLTSMFLHNLPQSYNFPWHRSYTHSSYDTCYSAKHLAFVFFWPWIHAFHWNTLYFHFYLTSWVTSFYPYIKI